MFKNFALIAKPQISCQSTIAETVTIVINYLQNLNPNIKIILEQETAELLDLNHRKNYLIVEKEQLQKHADLFIVLGGDGRFLSMSRLAALHNKPIIGINFGKLGFLTDIDLNKLDKLQDILHGNYSVEQRFVLQTSIQNPLSQHIDYSDIAVNDVAFMAITSGKMVNLTVYIDNQLVCSYRADGLLISTPTGSTGHILSGGGSILHPNVKAIIIAPMFSHNLTSRPLIVEAESNIKVVINNNNLENIKMICDGQNTVHLTPATEIYIKKAKNTLQLIHPLDYDYFATLRSKLGWEN